MKTYPIVPFKAWSFSSREQFLNCPKQYAEIRVAKNFEDVQYEHRQWGDDVHKALAQRLSEGTPLPAGMTQWERLCQQMDNIKGDLYVENQLCLNKRLQPVDWFAKDAWVRGIVDALWIDGDTARALDWKTGKRKPKHDQLALFALLVMHHYPQVQVVKTMYVWLKTFQTDIETFHRAQLTDLWQRFLPDVQRMAYAHDSGTFMARSSGLCSKWCPVITCLHNGKRPR